MHSAGSLPASRVRQWQIARACLKSSTPPRREWIGSAKALAHGILQPAAIEPRPPVTGVDSFNAIDAGKVTEVRQKNQQLRAILKTLPWPKLRRFQAHGRVYDLPLRASNGRSAAPLEAVTDSRLRFLAGFFDGDGSVSCVALSGCMLRVSQSFDQAVILMLLRDTFGGSIGLQKHGVGLCKPTLSWMLCGQSARIAAKQLAPHSITKREQLWLAAQWPETRSCREEWRAELRKLKEYDSAVAGPGSWEYFAGFFDAEGSIQQQSGGASLVLQIAQKHPRVLECLREFLARSLGKDVTLAKAGLSAHVLLVYGLTSCKTTLRHFLAAGLVCKAKQAELALSLTSENVAQVSSELVHLTGNQQFGKSLDPAGHERARRLRSLRQRARKMIKTESLQRVDATIQNLEALQLEHELLKALHENAQLIQYERYIRHLHNTCWEGPLADAM